MNTLVPGTLVFVAELKFNILIILLVIINGETIGFQVHVNDYVHCIVNMSYT